jgi:SagB-type dehydrogenase family enzyme
MKENIGFTYQQETKYHPEKMSARTLDWDNRPALYKEYGDAERVELPDPESRPAALFHNVIIGRKSVRKYWEKPLSTEQLSYLLWVCAGIRGEKKGYAFRLVPSAGALYPLEMYCLVNDVKTIKPGLYHYNVKGHWLEMLKQGNLGDELSDAALGQEMCREAPLLVIWTGIFRRSTWKYEERGYRYIYLDAGHSAQNLALAACSLGLGSCQIGAFFDDRVNDILDVDGEEESVIYMSTVGWPA